MTAILTISAVFLILYIFMWQFSIEPVMKKSMKTEQNVLYIIGVMFISAIIYLICASKYPGHKTDMNCFYAWSDMIFNDGIGAFYQSDAFHDYPPGYMYILYFIGAIRKLLGLSLSSSYILLKIPSLICNLLTGALIYKISKKYFDCKISSIVAALYLLNPAVISNGALWGQVDSVYTLAAAFMIYLICTNKMILSYFVFAICIFIKPQALIFTPLLILGIIENLFLNNFNINNILKNLLFGLGAIFMIILLALPFGFKEVIDQYFKTISEQYPYLTVNAFNLWGALGKNWAKLSTVTTVIGYTFIAAITLYSAYVFLKSKNRSKYYFVGAILSFMTYMLSIKMHDRYAFPAMVLMLLAFITSRSRKNYILYTLFTLSQFFNTVWVLFIYEQDINKYFQSPVIVVASIINVGILIYMVYCAQKEYVRNEMFSIVPENALLQKKQKKSGKNTSVASQIRSATPKFRFQLSEKLSKLTRFDLIAMAVTMLVYGGIAIYDLGDMDAPETETMISDNAVTIDLGADYSISKLKYFLGSYNLDSSRPLIIQYQNNSGAVIKTDNITSGAVFYWSEQNANVTARYITLSTTAQELSMKEFCVVGNNGTYITPINTSDKGVDTLYDEQYLIPERSNFRNSTYFDEIYHARTAYEFIHHLDIYEWTHPPLGKLIIAIGIMIFGMCPFGWRIAGTVVGILMIPAIYVFAKRFFNHSWLSLITCLLFTFDFMHFAQTRIATIDVYVTFFIILMYYFMFKYRCMSFYDTPFRKTLVPLACSGICMGLGIASKWTGAYAGAGLAVIFFVTLIRRYNEYRHALSFPKGETDGIKHSDIIAKFKPYTIKTILWCCIFFVLVPLIIYCCSYIPYMMTPSGNGLSTVIENANSMYTYHAKTVLGSEHPYSSRWYQWPIIYRPIWFYSGTVIPDTIKEGISSFGNPAVWWMGIPAFIYMVYLSIVKRDRKAMFLAIAYLAQYVPWIPISRLTFIYHYFPCVPFVTMMIGYSIYVIHKEAGQKQIIVQGKLTQLKNTHNSQMSIVYCAFAYTAIVLILFAMFYPVLSGHPCSVQYADTWLKWFKSWVLL
jgi:dolichyl-phosphate-mannose-protein mannosyltransferase